MASFSAGDEAEASPNWALFLNCFGDEKPYGNILQGNEIFLYFQSYKLSCMCDVTTSYKQPKQVVLFVIKDQFFPVYYFK